MITSSSNNRIKQLIQWNQKSKARKEDGVFIAEGIKMFVEAPLSWIREVYISESLFNRIPEELESKLDRCSYEVISNAIFEKVSDTQTPQGILCVLNRPAYTLSELCFGGYPLIMVLEDLQDPGNLGTIMRTAEGAGVTGIVMTSETVDVFNPKTIRATMGSIYRVPFLYVDSLADALSRLKRNGVRAYAAHLKGERRYHEINYVKGTAFLIGNEGNGLTQEAVSMADVCLKIPMEGQLESLNAGVAAGILMYEAHRQRH